MNDQLTVTLNNGVEMPRLGFGVFQVSDLGLCKETVAQAIETGYRLIDTASSYQNETAVGAAVAQCGLDRKDLFVTSKAFVQEMGYEKTKEAFARTLDNLGLDYLDLYLVHMPLGDYYGSWRAMEELYDEGLVRAIGVSNFLSKDIIDLCFNADVKPALNQLELHPFYQREPELEILREFAVAPQAWAPFAEGLNGLFTNPVLTAIAGRHEKSVSQIVLRWNLQRGVCVIPKSVHKHRMEENFAVWNFELTDEEMREIASLDLGRAQMLDLLVPSEVRRVYDYLRNPVLTSL